MTSRIALVDEELFDPREGELERASGSGDWTPFNRMVSTMASRTKTVACQCMGKIDH